MSYVMLVAADPPLPLYDSGIRRSSASTAGGACVQVETPGFSIQPHQYYRDAVEALGLEPEAVRTAPLPDALAEGAWDQTALELAWEWGLLPEDAGSAAEIARVQGGAMADAFAALL